jgi:adenylyl-sulfate kinase
LGFSDADREENIRRIGEVTKLMYDAGLVVITAFISPFRSSRERVRELFPAGAFWEVFVSCPLEVCKARDPNGLYKKAISGELPQFTGIGSRYEPPEAPELAVNSNEIDLEECVALIIKRLLDEGIIHEH